MHIAIWRLFYEEIRKMFLVPRKSSQHREIRKIECREYSAVQSNEGWFRREGSESFSCPEAPSARLWCPKSSSGAQLHPQSHDPSPSHRIARHLRHHHLRHHRSRVVLRKDAQDVLQQRHG
ncbi:hypothetical protein AVEN_141665-1, partial [Araneus ventricosus]